MVASSRRASAVPRSCVLGAAGEPSAPLFFFFRSSVQNRTVLARCRNVAIAPCLHGPALQPCACYVSCVKNRVRRRHHRRHRRYHRRHHRRHRRRREPLWNEMHSQNVPGTSRIDPGRTKTGPKTLKAPNTIEDGPRDPLTNKRVL